MMIMGGTVGTITRTAVGETAITATAVATIVATAVATAVAMTVAMMMAICRMF